MFAPMSKLPPKVFFAVSYKAGDAPGNVNWYFGASDQAASLDSSQSYNKGSVDDPNLPLAFGNFGSGRSKQTTPLATKNLLEDTDGLRGATRSISDLSMRWPSASADGRSSDDVIAF